MVALEWIGIDSLANADNLGSETFQGRRLQFGSFNQPIGFWVGVGIGGVALFALLVFASWYCCCFDRVRTITIDDAERDDLESGESGESGESMFRFSEEDLLNSNQNKDEAEESEEAEDEDDEDDDDDEEAEQDEEDEEERDVTPSLRNDAGEQSTLLNRNAKDKSDGSRKSSSKKDKKSTASKKAGAKKNPAGKKTGKGGKKKSANDDDECEVVVTYDHCDVGEQSDVFQSAARKFGLGEWTFSSLQK